MTTQTQMTENLFRNWKDIDKRVKYLRDRKMSEESRALSNALELASDIEDDNFYGNTTQIVNIIRAITEEYEVSRRDYEVMYKLCQGADAEAKKLQIELAGKEEDIKVLTKDIEYYRKDWKDQMIQDQGVDHE